MTKEEMRLSSRAERKAIPNKEAKDAAIAARLLQSSWYQNATAIFCYASLEEEIATDPILLDALSKGKTVALPRCTDREGNMRFYRIESLNDLKRGTFGVREPDPSFCQPVSPQEGTLLIVPGLCFDRRGYRIGYGGGYYDKFLENYSFISVGLCYNSLIQSEVPKKSYDRRVDYIITEQEILDTNHGGKNG